MFCIVIGDKKWLFCLCEGGCFVFVLGELFVDVILLGICFVVEVFLRWCGFLDEGWVKVIFGVGFFCGVWCFVCVVCCKGWYCIVWGWLCLIEWFFYFIWCYDICMNCWCVLLGVGCIFGIDFVLCVLDLLVFLYDELICFSLV